MGAESREVNKVEVENRKVREACWDGDSMELRPCCCVVWVSWPSTYAHIRQGRVDREMGKREEGDERGGEERSEE